ncbi:MAG: MBL fold metallo-hydrolase [Clostridia bacterium]|nr:MBL fold metallo-hydrolase [Clostridia bacterium]
MKKTYVTEMPNHIGAFLQASRCFAKLGINITRVSYNKAVDLHMLFIDADGTKEQLSEADILLESIGYLPKQETEPSIVLVGFKLRDVPGAVTPVLELIESCQFNISYISSQEDGSGYQLFKMGLFVEDAVQFSDFIEQAEKICSVQIIDYNRSEKVYDNSIFYRSFISGIADMTQIGSAERQELLVNSNLAMQTLDERGLLPYRTFDSIYCFSKLIAECKGESFKPRTTKYNIGEGTEITVIEPDCGSNTIVLRSGRQALFIDCGYACYQDEMAKLFHNLLPDFDEIEKTVLITHADVDHCGLLSMFDRVIASSKSAECLQNQYEGKDDFREQNPLHRPYIKICKILTGYRPVNPKNIVVPWNNSVSCGKTLEAIGTFRFGENSFTVYEGNGGHLPGEIVLIDYKHRIAFTGDIYVNVNEMTTRQKQYNKYAPILMTSVDTDASGCAQERQEFFDLLGSKGGWMIFGSHGAAKKM